jgi:DNA-binding CsgD family transcriptional regulator
VSTRPSDVVSRRRELDERHHERTRLLAAEEATLAAVATMLSDLRRVRDVPTLERRLCRDAVTACGFTRVMLSRVEGDVWRPWEVSFTVNPDFDRHFATHLRGTRIPFASSPAEDESRRTLLPVALGATAAPDSIPAPLEGLTGSYVVVPLVASTGVFGLLHGDHHPEPQHTEPHEQRALWLLADGFGDLYGRAVLGERLRAQRARLKHAMQALDAEVSAIAGAHVDLGSGLEGLPTDEGAPTIREHSALTRRERDVAGLLARGFGNAAIGRDLLIAEGTVKSHVKAILRKLGAANRTEAIAILLGHPTRG